HPPHRRRHRPVAEIARGISRLRYSCAAGAVARQKRRASLCDGPRQAFAPQPPLVRTAIATIRPRRSAPVRAALSSSVATKAHAGRIVSRDAMALRRGSGRRKTSTMIARFTLAAVFIIAHVTATIAAESKEFTNSIGMKLVLVPAGEFLMGS